MWVAMKVMGLGMLLVRLMREKDVMGENKGDQVRAGDDPSHHVESPRGGDASRGEYEGAPGMEENQSEWQKKGQKTVFEEGCSVHCCLRIQSKEDKVETTGVRSCGCCP